MEIYWKLYSTWFKMGLFTFGGGYAMLPMIQREVIEKQHWATEDEIMDYYAIGQCTPGVIAVNTATFVGYTQKGVLGGIVSTLGVITPSLIIICLIAGLLTNFQDLPVVQHALGGIRIGVCALLLVSIWKLATKSMRSIFGVCMAVGAFVLAYFAQISTVWIVLLAGLCGAILSPYLLKKKGEQA